MTIPTHTMTIEVAGADGDPARIRRTVLDALQAASVHARVLSTDVMFDTLRVKVPIQCVQVGDVICDSNTNFNPEVVTRAYVADTGEGAWGGTLETDKHGPDNVWISSPGYEPTVVFSPSADFVRRTADNLEKFGPATVRAVLRMFCPECGERGCAKHR